MSKYTMTTMSDDGLKAETRDVSHELLKALDAFQGMTEREQRAKTEMDKEEALGRADAGAWFLEVLTRATNTIGPMRVCGNTPFAVARAKEFNVNLKEFRQRMREKLEAADREVTALRNQR
jgi:hypothetical protein